MVTSHFSAHAGPSTWNNAFVIRSLDPDEERERCSPSPPDRMRRVSKQAIKTEFCLPERLPSTAFIEREAQHLAPRTMSRQLHKEPESHQDLEGHLDDAMMSNLLSYEGDNPVLLLDSPPRSRSPDVSPTASPTASIRSGFFDSVKKAFPNSGGRKSMASATGGGGEWKEPQSWQVLKAVETKDVMYLMEVRDRAFHLLLRRTGDATPLLHAIRIGASHKEVAIILTGAMSRFVNHVEDEDMDKPKTKALLKALRTNLKLAIDSSLLLDQPDLVASFLQTLVMSEGDRWLTKQIYDISLALRAPVKEGRPVSLAGEAVRSFATRELGRASTSGRIIAALEDYVANATADLVMMALWSMVQERIPESEPIPLYHFARDDRVYRGFCTRLTEYKTEIGRQSTKQMRWQMKVIEVGMEGKRETMRRKVEIVREALDEGDGTTNK